MKRILTVIFASDVAGYSRLVAQDEEGTIAKFREASAILFDLVKKYQGSVFNTAGDAILAKFDSAVDATRCAIDFQDVNNANNDKFADDKKVLFRIGVAIGDVLVSDDGDLLGDAVNVAARLENIAEAGGICISDDVRAHVLNKIHIKVVDLGDQNLHNIPRAIRVFKLVSDLKDVAEHHWRFVNWLIASRRPAQLLAAIAGLALLGLAAFHWWPSSPSGPGWSEWADELIYQREFNRQVSKKWYPRMLEAKLIGDVVMYRGYFEPYPAATFSFYSHHSLNDEDFAARDTEHLGQGFRRIFQQRIVVGTRPFNQGTWTKP